ncbi:hypothetical protein BV25DRAFT_687231 [Artomyces pyxidatus]|uniref:Uncharacterized protein n=1 Tax=Artomyces pyxidatus TaxID=48021 RepID=A0ACB8T1L9_9AGAM|nr:hypothetical protein BV25DRAFT_687231 [Artomyces pyxidatus]
MLTLDGTISDEYIALLLKLRKQLETVDKMANEDVPVKAKVPDIVAVMDAVDAVWRGPMSVSDRKTRYSVAQQLVWRLERIIEEPFKEYLQKVLSIRIAYSHIAHICQTSESSQFLFRPYSVTSVQAEVRPLRLNVTRCIITAVRRNMPFADNPRTTRNIAEVFKKSVTERLPHLAPGFTQESDGLILIVPKVVVHAPCALLNYLHRSRVPPFAYFGLSKSCCCACDIYIFRRLSTSQPPAVRARLPWH